MALQTDASALTEESCTQYNMLKTARYLFRHTGDPGRWVCVWVGGCGWVGGMLPLLVESLIAFLLFRHTHVKGVEKTFEKSINVVRLYSWLVMTTPAQKHNTPLGAL